MYCLGDGHAGIWNIFKEIGDNEQRQEILDWYHLKEKSLQGRGFNKTIEISRKYVMARQS